MEICLQLIFYFGRAHEIDGPPGILAFFKIDKISDAHALEIPFVSHVQFVIFVGQQFTALNLINFINQFAIILCSQYKTVSALFQRFVQVLKGFLGKDFKNAPGYPGAFLSSQKGYKQHPQLYLCNFSHLKDSIFRLFYLFSSLKSIHTKKLLLKTAHFPYFHGLTINFFCMYLKRAQKAKKSHQNGIFQLIFSP